MARIAWYCSNNPFPSRGGADVRVSGLMGLALAEGHEILLVHTSPLHPDNDGKVRAFRVPDYRGFGRRSRRLFRADPVSTVLPDPTALADCKRELDAFEPEVSVMSELFPWPIVSRLLGSTPLIYDAHNVERDLHRQIQGLLTDVPHRVLAEVDRPRISRVERRVLATSSAVWATSTDDRSGLLATCPSARIMVAPNSCPTPAAPCDPSKTDANILFVGNLSYEPNIRAIQTLVGTVLPAVLERCPGAGLSVVGNNAADLVTLLIDGNPSVSLHVGVPDLEPYYSEARVVVVPMTHGSGTNIKVLEAMSYGVPVVASPVALRGLPITDGEGVVVRDSPVSIADATVSLLQDPQAAARLGRLGRDVFLQRLAWSVASADAVNAGLDQALGR